MLLQHVLDHLRHDVAELALGVVGPVTSLPRSNMYRRLVFDSVGSAWLGGAEDGIRRLVADDAGERFRVEQSLFGDQDEISSPVTLSLTRDDEGNIWVGTLLGLDRFSARRALRSAGLPLSYVFDTFAASDGESYLISNNSLFRIDRAGPVRLAAMRWAETICGVRDGAVTVAAPSGLFVYADGRVRRIPMPKVAGDDDPHVYGCTFDANGRLLLSLGRHPLYRLEQGGWRAIGNAAPEIAYGFLPAPNGGTLVVYPKDRIDRLVGDRSETLWSSRQGAIGFIKTAAAGRKCTLFGAQNGLGCLRGNRMQLLSAATYPQLINVSGIIETPHGWTWLVALPGIMRVRSDELNAAFEAPGRPLHFQPFGAEDGLRGETMMMHPRNAVADRFGRLWFFTSKGLVSLDLAGVEGPPRPPRTVIKSLTSNGRVFDLGSAVTLPVGTRSFQVDYTATALTDPKGTTFRYMLEGVDPAWIDAGSRRQAFYTNLAPGRYRFRVSAVSSAGTVSTSDASIDIEIKPGFMQTWWFMGLCLLLAALLATLVYRWRVRSLAARFSERLQERLDERERIARELHDTLLQGVSGLLLQFQGLAARVPKGEPLRADMERALDRAEDVVVEGRNRVRNLRAAEGPCNLEDTLALALTRPGLDQSIRVDLQRSGVARPVTEEAANELAALAAEALGNAIRHGGAQTLTVKMTFSPHELRVRFEDDGVGIPQSIAAAGSRPGHYGLIGMRERIERLQGTFAIERLEPHGTRIETVIPGRCAYPRVPGLLGALRAKFGSLWRLI